ncbi:MAG: N-6 DNA methylase [Actinobacteria bacterium]|nr:N-6 DNA methylase [Actinomycetota bacterium]
MADIKRSEISYLIQNILPLFSSQLGFPLPEDEENIKIDQIPVRIASGVKKPDVVYYWEGIPVFLIEAKRDNKSEEDAIDQALSYIKNYPIDEYSRDSIRPRFFAITIGKQISFYAHRFEIDKNNFKDWYEKLESPIFFEELLQEYGLKRIEKKVSFNPDIFRKEILNELGPIYNLEKKITPEVVKNLAHQILSFLQYGKDYTSHKPYLDLENYKDRQAQVRHLYEKFDWINSIGPETAKEFRSYILRSFQGTNLNQYLTEQCVIDFMLGLIGSLDSNTKVLDFECGSGGFLAAAIYKGADLSNIRGIDIDELPYIIAKTYMAIYFKKTGNDGIESIPIIIGNGLFNQGREWDLIIGNPAGGNKYEHGGLEKIGENIDLDFDRNGIQGNSLSEYNLSIRQSVLSSKVGGKICLVLPEGFFSNSRDEILRNYVSKYCKILAIISLPRGVFKKGTSTKQQKKGSQTSSQKMSIIYATKINCVEDIDYVNDKDFSDLSYPVFLATISQPKSKIGLICDWLEPQLDVIQEQWQEWQSLKKIKEIQKVIVLSKSEKNKDKKGFQIAISEKVNKKTKTKPIEVKTKTTINKNLKDLFS